MVDINAAENSKSQHIITRGMLDVKMRVNYECISVQ